MLVFLPSLPLFLQLLRGNVGLLFTNEDNSVVKDWFESYYEMDHARSGFVATQRVALDEGKYIILSYLFLSLSLFSGPLDQFPHSIEPHLRSLGLPTKLQKGKVHLLQDHVICNPGDTLTPEQARLLVSIVCVFCNVILRLILPHKALHGDLL